MSLPMVQGTVVEGIVLPEQPYGGQQPMVVQNVRQQLLLLPLLLPGAPPAEKILGVSKRLVRLLHPRQQAAAALHPTADRLGLPAGLQTSNN